MFELLFSCILFATVLLGLLLLHQAATSPATWFFHSWFVFTLTALLRLAAPEGRWLYDSYVIYGSLSAPLALGGTLILLERRVPSWLLPGVVAVALGRFVLLESGLPTIASAGALLTTPLTGFAAYLVFKHGPQFGSSRALRILGPAFVVHTGIGVASVLTIVAKGPETPILLLSTWLVAGLIMLGIQLYAVGERQTNALRQSRDALEQQVQERTAELARSNESLQQEVEERREALLALERSEDRYRTVSELSSDFSFSLLIDPEHGVRREWVTEAFERITGYPAESLDGRRWAALLQGAEGDSASPVEGPRPDASGTLHYRVVRPSGEVRHLDIKFRQTTHPGTGVTRVVGAARDVTDSHVSEEARVELERQVEAAQRVESLGMLTGGIAHDFNNLLAVILGNTRLAQEELPEGSPSLAKLARIRTAAEHAARLTEQMLTYSGKAIVSLAPVDVSGLAGDLSELLRASVGGDCTVRLELGEGGVIEGDATRLSQVILNLVVNAHESLADGRGTVTLRTGQGFFDTETLAATTGSAKAEAGDYVWFEVSDDGCGMDEDTRRRIFEPFFSTKFSGRGLGLASAMGIVRAHGGRVELESELGVGTRVRVLLPLSEQKPTLEVVPAPVEPLPERALVVDDDEAVLELAEEFLRRAGYESHRATGGQEAIELFQKNATEIDVVVLDLTMPDIDGREVLQALRRIRADIPVVLATGYSRGMLEETFPDETLVSFLRKPYEPEQLIDAIRAAKQNSAS